MVRALDPAVVCVLWQAIYHHLPEHVDNHPLGCHRKRVPDLLCFRGILIRLVTGSSWETVEALMEYKVSDTTLRARREHDPSVRLQVTSPARINLVVDEVRGRPCIRKKIWRSPFDA